MLDEKDLQAISQLMAQQKQEIIGELDTRMDQKMTDFKRDTIAMMEAYFNPKFNLLAEGQKNILETLAPKNRVEKLEEEVDSLKTVIRALSRDVAELKKAQ